jgi:membrane protein implicated in regulation of membrane protease activity
VIFEKTLMTLAAAAAIAAAAAVAVVSAAFAIYAVLVPLVTAAGAAAIVSAVAALIVAVAGMIAARKVEGRHHHHGQQAPPQAFDMTGKIVEIVRDKPLMSIGIGLAAGIFALKNPTLTASLAKAFLDPKPPQR